MSDSSSIYFSSDSDSSSQPKSNPKRSTTSLHPNSSNTSSFSPNPNPTANPPLSLTQSLKLLYTSALLSLSQKPILPSPSHLTCRDLQTQKLSLYLNHCLSIMGKTSLPSLYICGVPGIGKTLTINTVLHQFTKQHFGYVKWVMINGMEMRRVSKVYSVILKKLVKRKSKKPYYYLDLLLTKGVGYPYPEDIALIENKMKIIVIDEIDYFLEEKYQTTLFQFLQWANNVKTRVILIGLSNTINFVEKLNYKINSRMQLSVNLLFQSYSPSQIETILRSRLGQHMRLFEKTTLTKISTIIGRFSSDIRAALSLSEKSLRMAMEEAVEGGKEVMVNEQHVDQSIQVDPCVEMMRGFSIPYKILLLTLIGLMNSNPKKDQTQLVTFSLTQLLQRFTNMCQKQGENVEGCSELVSEIERSIYDLNRMRIIEIQKIRRLNRGNVGLVNCLGEMILVPADVVERVEKMEEFRVLK